ncbi:TlpA family protein disulfide reductase [Novipirellula aureliae]|nr:TlpA disulfide reductase family protein [Novipirellula aureliae]
MTDSSKFDYPDGVEEMTPEEKENWYAEWVKTDEGIAFTTKQQQIYAVVVGDDGAFRADDVPAGDYVLTLSINATMPHGQCRIGESLGTAVHYFTIPEMPSGRSDEPLDVGHVTLELRRFVNVGDTAPSLQATTLSGDAIKLSDFAGKYALLDFWATWCGPYLAEMPNLRKAQEQYKDDERLVIE